MTDKTPVAIGEPFPPNAPKDTPFEPGIAKVPPRKARFYPKGTSKRNRLRAQYNRDNHY